MGTTSPERILIFTATYNERDNIEEFCDRVFSADGGLELLVVDDSSPDGTGRILDRIQEVEPRLRVLHRPRKLGLGTAHKLAMLYSILNGYDILVTMDSDFSHDPAYIPALLEELQRQDFVIGSRYMKGGESDYRGYRRLVSSLANWSARVLLGIPLHEFTTSFRAFRVEILKGLDLSRIRSQGYSFFLESLCRITRRGIRCGEVPIHFHDRKAGKSKIPRLEIIHGMQKLLGLVLSRPFSRSPASKFTLCRRLNCARCQSPYVLEESVSKRDERGRRLVSCLTCGERSHVSRKRPVKKKRKLAGAGSPQ